MSVKLVAALIVQLGGQPSAAAQLAPLVVKAAVRYRIEPKILVAVVRNESSFRPTARGALGELGLCQLKRETMATRGFDHLSDEALMDPALNLRLGARHLARARRICGGHAAPAAAWLSVYNGRKKCRPSAYSTRVLSRLK